MCNAAGAGAPTAVADECKQRKRASGKCGCQFEIWLEHARRQDASGSESESGAEEELVVQPAPVLGVVPSAPLHIISRRYESLLS